MNKWFYSYYVCLWVNNCLPVMLERAAFAKKIDGSYLNFTEVQLHKLKRLQNLAFENLILSLNSVKYSSGVQFVPAEILIFFITFCFILELPSISTIQVREWDTWQISKVFWKIETGIASAFYEILWPIVCGSSCTFVECITNKH